MRLDRPEVDERSPAAIRALEHREERAPGKIDSKLHSDSWPLEAPGGQPREWKSRRIRAEADTHLNAEPVAEDVVDVLGDGERVLTVHGVDVGHLLLFDVVG